MSDDREYALPRGLSRRALTVYAFAALICDEVGVVPGGQAALAECLQHSDRTKVWQAVEELEQRRVMKRIGKGPAQRLVLVVMLPFRHTSESLCETCGIRPKQRIRGAKECATCLQAIGRRIWKAEAVELWAKGVQRGDSDWKIAYAIHATTKRPLWGRSEEGEQGSGSGEGEGVIPAMIAMGLFPEDMMRAARNARKGDDLDDF